MKRNIQKSHVTTIFPTYFLPFLFYHNEEILFYNASIIIPVV